MVPSRKEAEREAERALATLVKEVDDLNEIVWFSDRATLALVLGEYAMFFFGQKAGKIGPLRLKLQCEGAGSAFPAALIFNVGGRTFRLDTERRDWSIDHGSGKTWDILDFPISRRQPDLAEALAKADSAMVRFERIDVAWDWPVSLPQMEAMRRVHAVWSALRADSA